jgi:hypothetical protein
LMKPNRGNRRVSKIDCPYMKARSKIQLLLTAFAFSLGSPETYSVNEKS